MEHKDSSSFSLLTYNINDEAVSDSAPHDWSLATQHDHIRDVIYRHAPDLLCLQECFSFPSRLTQRYDFHGSTPSHRGDCYIATRKGGPLQADGPATPVGPCVLLPLRLGDRRFYAACAHLAPFNQSKPVRATQLARISKAAAASPPAVPLVLAGDLNMREAETSVAADNELLDAWLEAGSPGECRWTWDTRVNRYYREGHAYTARYDRVLYRGMQLRSFEVVANQPCSKVAAHFLSDHFGIVARLQLMDAGSSVA